MLKEITLTNIKVDNGELSKSILSQGKGKILKVLVEFSDKLDTEVNVKISTKEGEEVINVNSTKLKEIYYPRANVITQRYNTDSLMIENNFSLDYYYFSGGILFTFEKDNINSEMILIKKLVILYEIV